jgi:hypothetical protein
MVAKMQFCSVLLQRPILHIMPPPPPRDSLKIHLSLNFGVLWATEKNTPSSSTIASPGLEHRRSIHPEMDV